MPPPFKEENIQALKEIHERGVGVRKRTRKRGTGIKPFFILSIMTGSVRFKQYLVGGEVCMYNPV